MKYPIFILGFIFSFFSSSAQTHDYTSTGCRYFKCPPGQHCAVEEGAAGCPACRKDFDDEIKAVAEESKRKADEKAAQELVEKQKREEEFKKINEQRTADENNKIFIVSPKPEKEKSSTIKITKTENATIKLPNYKGKLFPNTIYNNGLFGVAFTNDKGDTILKSTEFYRELEYSVDEMPDNTAIVTYNYKVPGKYPNVNFKPMNLVNAKGQKLLKGEDINNIKYCKNNLFLIYRGGGFTSDVGDYGTSISLFDFTNNTFQEIPNTITPGFNYINQEGVDTKNFYGTYLIITRNKLTGKAESNYGDNIPAMKSLYESKDWIVIIIMPVAFKWATPKYEVLFVDKNKKINTFMTLGPN